jgi:stage II sporulation protein D
MKKQLILVFAFLLFLPAGRQVPFSFPCFAQTSNLIRVRILQDAKSVALVISGSYEIINAGNQEILGQGKSLKTTATIYKDGFLIGKMTYQAKRVFLKTWGPNEIAINSRKFKGNIQLIKDDDVHFSAINFIELEDYIKGVLYHEASHYWPEEILKAQAIVCRTFALYQKQENQTNDYDVTSDTYSQMYGGSTSERYRTNRTVEQTCGLVLAYNGKIFPAYYHATCAGRTEDASLLWNINIPPLKGVSCGFCNESPHFNWHEVISQADFKWSLRKAGLRLKKIKAVEIIGKDNSGRITELKLIDNDKDTRISAKDLRNYIGPNLIRSTNFTITLAGDDIIFEGLGWGHGVGLCQWGGYFMAKKGRSYKEILEYYYPESGIIQQ